LESHRQLFPLTNYSHFRFSFPVSIYGSLVDISGFRCRPMSGNIGSAISESRILENIWVAFGIASPALSRLNVISTSGSVTTILGFQCRPMSGPIRGAIPWSGMVENVRAAVEVSFVVATQA